MGLELSFFKNFAKHKVFLFPLVLCWSSGARSFSSRYEHCILNKKLDTCNNAMCLNVVLCGVSAILKNKKA